MLVNDCVRDDGDGGDLEAGREIGVTRFEACEEGDTEEKGTETEKEEDDGEGDPGETLGS